MSFCCDDDYLEQKEIFFLDFGRFKNFIWAHFRDAVDVLVIKYVIIRMGEDERIVLQWEEVF